MTNQNTDNAAKAAATGGPTAGGAGGSGGTVAIGAASTAADPTELRKQDTVVVGRSRSVTMSTTGSGSSGGSSGGEIVEGEQEGFVNEGGESQDAVDEDGTTDAIAATAAAPPPQANPNEDSGADLVLLGSSDSNSSSDNEEEDGDGGDSTSMDLLKDQIVDLPGAASDDNNNDNNNREEGGGNITEVMVGGVPVGKSVIVQHRRKNKTKNKTKKNVTFHTITIREYEQTVGVNPFCSYGCPISLDWDYTEYPSQSLHEYETTRPPRRSRRGMLTSYYQRRDTLLLNGHTPEQLEKAAKDSGRLAFRRSITLTFLPVFILEEKVVLGVGYVMSKRRGTAEESAEEYMERLSATGTDGSAAAGSYHSDYDEESQPPRGIMRRTQSSIRMKSNLHRSISRSLSGLGSGQHQRRRSSSASNTTTPTTTTKHRRRSISDAENIQDLYSDHDGSGSSHSRWEPDRHDDRYVASHDSNYDRYRVRVDHNQHDKASEIKLCQFSRPHMRAFHASWMSFFTAFFMWFAITPLLGEVKATLSLTKEQIWTSSLCGTAGTIVMRIVMGPLCDKFGARLCMASILLASALPCALTGLVETSQGLSTVRSFVGIAGASFVACQYWTSSMFTREVAGTANALVAGWGNLGGGVTQLIMGSVIFPLLKYAYGGDSNENSAEQAWRTSFVFPAVLAIGVAIGIILLCDDSPKGDYRARVRAQEVMIASPCDSLNAAILNWNAWALMFQYSCCFGVEVTMTNAAALYFKERFGQSTETAAAIASVFGFMNLFARGLGGLGSDTYNTKYGMKGRLGWQFFSLFVQGAFIVAFAFARTLTGAIFALIFTSIMVQSAEGSSFGIVPYVSRRYTGGIVGFVGAGGNVGGVMFAAIFRAFDDMKAFYIMGAAASLSAFLSFTIKMKGQTSFVTCGSCLSGGQGNRKKSDE
eukprot:CAMPEP_0178484870 /NCGR_PEP_ID=MMETSP0696-20121128/7978_1 /TAXON_ID=265572 /ORGANISM="Extubocellulus spinifer, Strain CCMP396" /LENGTH=928 /DNA_ID=CAMNT_0020112443 /DNA_START=199 /DNA_END=2985 /DNA_ORIENTATION=+